MSPEKPLLHACVYLDKSTTLLADPLLVCVHISSLEPPYAYGYLENLLQKSHRCGSWALQLIILTLGGCRLMGISGGWAGMGA